MLQQLTNLFNDYWAWGTGLLALAAGLSWLPGGAAVVGIIVAGLKIAAGIFESLAPIFAAIFQGFIWIWQKIVWPGILDIIDSIATILTVCLIVGLTWFFFVSRYEIQHIRDQRTINYCKADLARTGKRMATDDAEPEAAFELPWPFKWRWPL